MHQGFGSIDPGKASHENLDFPWCPQGNKRFGPSTQGLGLSDTSKKSLVDAIGINDSHRDGAAIVWSGLWLSTSPARIDFRGVSF